MVARLYGMLFCLVIPSILTYALFEFGVPHGPLSADQWTLVLLIPASVGLGAFLWWSAEFEYEFTGDEIICRKGGLVRWRLLIGALSETRVEYLRDGTQVWHLRAAGRSRSVVVIDSLARYLAGHKQT